MVQEELLRVTGALRSFSTMRSTRWIGFVAVMATPEAKKFFEDIGLEPDTSTPEGLAEHVRTQTELWGRLIKESGLEKI